jgi:hypothetical protein
MKPFLILAALCSTLNAADPAPLAKATAEMADAANAFLKSLNEEQTKKARFPFDSDERENFQFVPKERQGHPLPSAHLPRQDDGAGGGQE